MITRKTARQALRAKSVTVQHLHVFTVVYHVSQRDTGSCSYHSEATSLPPAQRFKWLAQNHICNDKSTADDEGSRCLDNKSFPCLEVVCRVNRDHFVERCCGIWQRCVRGNRPDTHHNLHFVSATSSSQRQHVSNGFVRVQSRTLMSLHRRETVAWAATRLLNRRH